MQQAIAQRRRTDLQPLGKHEAALELARGDAAAFADLEAATVLDPDGAQADTALVLAHLRANNFDAALRAVLTSLTAVGATGKAGEVTRVPAPEGAAGTSVIAVGLGDPEELTDETVRRAAGSAARSLAGIEDASSTEFGEAKEPVVGLMTEWLKGNMLEKRRASGDLGGTMRLGAFPARLGDGTRIASIYGTTEISERHRHRYEVNIDYKERLEACGLVFSGMSPDGVLPETIEYADHPWFIGVQYHPELKSRPFEPHPLFASFIAAAVEQSRLV